MTSRDFCFWLQGFLELSGQSTLDCTQTETLRRHLNLVFKHEIDPSIGGNPADLQAIHDGKKFPFAKAGDTDALMRC